jgi:hypothetical protein
VLGLPETKNAMATVKPINPELLILINTPTSGCEHESFYYTHLQNDFQENHITLILHTYFI